MHFEDGRVLNIPALSEEYSDSINRLYQVIHSSKKASYTISSWVECLASLHYLKQNVMSFDATVDDVVRELERRKSHLNQHNVNLLAYDLVEGLFV